MDLNGAGKILRDVGVPVALAAYLLLRLDGQMLHVIRTMDEINTRLLVVLTTQPVPHVPQRR